MSKANNEKCVQLIMLAFYSFIELATITSCPDNRTEPAQKVKFIIWIAIQFCANTESGLIKIKRRFSDDREEIPENP